MAYYSISKKEKILTQATTWMDLEGIMLPENSQSQEDRCCMVPLTGVDKFITDRKQNGRAGAEGGRGALVFNRD